MSGDTWDHIESQNFDTDAFDWDTATERERDAAIAEHVMGYGEIRWLLCWSDPETGEWRPHADQTTEAELVGIIEYSREPCHWPGDDEPMEKPSLWYPVHNFTTRADNDYLVLERVRAAWNRRMTEVFYIELRKILNSKMFGVYRSMSYEPGDWSHAAYLALQETER